MTNLRLLDPMFGDSFETALRRFFPATLAEPEPGQQLKMRIDVTENDTAYTVRADLPGVKKDDINVSVEGNLVRIDAQCRSEKETREGEKVLRSERHYGSISRAFSLGQDIDAGKVEAKYVDGVLTLQLPKMAQSESRRIAIQ